MGSEVWLSESPIRVTVQGWKQLLADCVEVGAFDDADFLLMALGVEGTTPSAVVKITTHMVNDSEDGWQDLVVFTAVTTRGYERKTGTVRPLKFLRIEVPTLTGSANPSVTFWIPGMLRRYV
jgi:hypothetical protein